MGDFFQRVGEFFAQIGDFFGGLFGWFESFTSWFGSWYGVVSELIDGAPLIVLTVAGGLSGLAVFSVIWAILRGK